MKTVLLLLLIVLLCIVIGSLIRFFHRVGKPVNADLSDSYYYHAWKNKVIYAPMGNWFELGYHELDSDPSSFIVLTTDFGKDNKTVFWKGYPQNVDYSTFEIDAQQVPKDKMHVYYDFGYLNSLPVIDGADPKSYQAIVLDPALSYSSWGKDKNFIYVDGTKVEADPATFKVLNKTLAVDANSLYCIKTKSEQVIGTPRATQVVKKANHPGEPLKVISENYLQAGNTIILSNWKNEFSMLPFDRIDSVQLIDERNIIVNSEVLISDGERIEGINVSSLQILNRDFMKDTKYVFYDRKKINAADPETFVPVFEEYSKDRKHVFYQDNVLEDVDPSTFTYNYATQVATDGKRSFKNGKIIQNK